MRKYPRSMTRIKKSIKKKSINLEENHAWESYGKRID